MSEDHIRYDLLTQAALRGVVRNVLADIAESGLPGDHHLKISFATAAPGVRLSERMRAQYPESMTIILQHQFWDLVVREDAFDVGLSFGGVGELLTVPFEAVTAFFDPSVNFGFQFAAFDAAATGEAGPAATSADKPTVSAPQGVPETTRTDALPAAATRQAPNGPGGEVVSLDRFRKK